MKKSILGTVVGLALVAGFFAVYNEITKQQVQLDRHHLLLFQRIKSSSPVFSELVATAFGADLDRLRSCTLGLGRECLSFAKGWKTAQSARVFGPDDAGIKSGVQLKADCLTEADCRHFSVKVDSHYSGWLPGVRDRSSLWQLEAREWKKFPKPQSDHQFSRAAAQRWFKNRTKSKKVAPSDQRAR